MFERVLTRCSADVHHDTRKGIAEGHAGTCLQVVAVLYGTGKSCRHVFHSREGEHVGHEVRLSGQIALHTVEQCIEPLVCSEPGRNGNHQFGVHNGQNGKRVVGSEPDFFMRLLVGNDSPGVCL